MSGSAERLVSIGPASLVGLNNITLLVRERLVRVIDRTSSKEEVVSEVEAVTEEVAEESKRRIKRRMHPNRLNPHPLASFSPFFCGLSGESHYSSWNILGCTEKTEASDAEEHCRG